MERTLTGRHRHRVAVTTFPVSDRGGLITGVFVGTCPCGATRTTTLTERHEERGPWIEVAK